MTLRTCQDGVQHSCSRTGCFASQEEPILASDGLVPQRSLAHVVVDRQTARLEGSIVIDGVTVAPRGTFVHGRIAQAQQARRAVGSSELSVEFTDIVIDDQFFPISTGGLSAQTGGEAGRTVGRTARAAAVGGLIGGSSGARTGARVGLGASILTSGASVNIPRGTIVETSLTAALTLPVG